MMAATKKKKKETMALHVKAGDTHVVGIGNLRVVIVPDGKFWFAQGLEIDYAVQGNSEAEAKKNFEMGLEATIEQHLMIHGHIEKLLKVAPPGVWKEFLSDPAGKKKFYSQLTAHDLTAKLPYAGIQYLVARDAHA
jgi:hypothetical protein